MRQFVWAFALSVSTAFGALGASPEQEAAFVATYKQAFEAQDAAALDALLFADGAIPMAVDFYKMAMTAEFGKPITSIELLDLTAEDEAQVSEVMPTPDGGNARLAPKPYKKLVVVIETSDGNGSSKSTSTAYVAEHDGRLGIAMPVSAD